MINTMNELISLLSPFAAGALLGLLFFGGLWLTVTKGMSSPHPALWFFISMLLRTGVVLTGFYFVTAGQLERLLACLAGFIVSRLIISHLLKASGKELPARKGWL